MFGNDFKKDMKSLSDAYASMYEKKEDCKDGYKWDKDEKKCVKKSSKTSIIVGRGYGGYHDHDDDKEDGNEGGGGDAGGGDGGGGGE